MLLVVLNEVVRRGYHNPPQILLVFLIIIISTFNHYPTKWFVANTRKICSELTSTYLALLTIDNGPWDLSASVVTI